MMRIPFLTILFFAITAVNASAQQNPSVEPPESDLIKSKKAVETFGLPQDSIAVTYEAAPLEVKKIENGDLEKYRDDPAFDYEVVKAQRTWWDDFTEWLGYLLRRFFGAIFGVEKAPLLLANFLKVLPYLLLGVLLYLLIRFFNNVNISGPGRKLERGSVGLSEEEHLIRNEDLQRLVQNALEDKNYRLAIRYYYLYLLQVMTEKNIIAWELQKTNDDYLREIKSTDLKSPFKQITRWYDYIWYGEFHINESGYQKAEKAFSSLKNTLNGHG